ncbi:MAG: DNA polymerase III subunit delta' [Pseudomonadota bacterium]
MTLTPAWPVFGHQTAERAVSDAMQSGRMHHAWLFDGPSGIGKSRLARRFAAVLLGADRFSESTLEVASDDPVVEKMEAGAHPDFRWLSRQPNEKGKLPLYIPVDQVREDLVNFFTLKPALGGKRVCVVDAVDELNASGANALLKSLEEPPSHCVLILIYHGHRPILPTIRSRCRRLRFSPLDETAFEKAIERAPISVQARAKAFSGGRPGRAMALSEPDAMAGLSAAETLLGHLDRGALRDVPSVFASAAKSDESFGAFASGLLEGLSRRAIETPGLASAWLWVTRTLDHASRDAMDRGQTTAKLVSGLQEHYSAA